MKTKPVAWMAPALIALSSTGALAQTMMPPPMLSGTKLDVVTEGTVSRVPDLATISAGVVTEAPTAAAAMRENANRMSATIAALKKAGVAARDIQTSAINLNPQYRYTEGKPPVITGYQASNQVNIRFRDVARAGSILDTLVAEGANQINGPSLSVDQPASALDEARIAAVKAARARADLYAGAAGLRVKRILSISEQQGYTPQPYPMVMAMSREKASADTQVEPGEQKLAVTVAVSFELE